MNTINGSLAKLVEPLLPDVNSNSTSYFKKYCVTRLYCLLTIPLLVIASLADGILGVVGSIAVLLTLGKVKKVCHFSHKHLFSFASLPIGIFLNTLLFVNPKADPKNFLPDEQGPYSGILSERLLDVLYEQKPSPAWLHKVTTVAFVLPLFITTIVDGIFGALAGVFALVTLGNWQKCNHFVKNLCFFPYNGMHVMILLIGKDRFDSHYLLKE